MMVRFFFVSLFACWQLSLKAQTLGGNTVFNFVNQPNSAQLSALGGVNISQLSTDVGLTMQNPALLRPIHDGWVNASFNNLFAGVQNYSLAVAYTSKKYKTNVGAGIQYFDYGSIAQTDVSGNRFGNFKAADYVAQLSASHAYKDYWFIGAAVKFMQSSYGVYSSNGLAVDVGLNYIDTSKQLQLGLVIKNMGTQLQTYNGSSNNEELPFDIQLGVSKKLLHAPIQFSLTAHHLQAFNIYYNDTLFQNQEGNTAVGGKKFTLQKILSHLVLATQFYVSNKIEVTAGYNFLRRNNLTVFNATSGLNGFTLGGGLLLKHLQLRYGSGFYQQKMFNQVSINVWLR